MRSPFPGMDPYLEKHWGDVHARLITTASSFLNKTLPRQLRARIEERIFLESEDAKRRVVIPDVRVVEHRKRTDTSAPFQSGGAAVAEPIIVRIDDEPVTEHYIEIVDSEADCKVITVIEFLSPGNKTLGPGRDLFAQKRDEMKKGGVNYVEIDLVRSGERELMVPQFRLPKACKKTYQACIWRATKCIEVECYGFPLEVRLPMLRIPLRAQDPDALLDMQALIDQCYEEGRYDTLDYTVPPDPPLEAAEAAWAEELLKSKPKE